jgi:hypothetical protein
MTTVTTAMIDAAADALALSKIQTKIQLEQAVAYEIDLAAAANHRAKAEAEFDRTAAHRAAMEAHNATIAACMTRQATAAEAMFLELRKQGTAFDASERGKVMQNAFEQLMTVYMKPSTATTPAGRSADVEADSNFLLQAVERVMGTYDALRTP